MIQFLDRLLSTFEKTMIVVLTLAGLLMAFVQVVLRYAFNTGIHWLEAGLVTALVWAMLIGAVRGVRQGAHPRVDLLPHLMPPLIRAIMNAVALLATLALVCFYLFDSIFYAQFIDKINALHPELGIKMVYPFLIIPLITALMALRYILLAAALWKHADSKNPEADYRSMSTPASANQGDLK